MPRSFVALDLETTGLNPERDAIIEVGAVRFCDGQPVEEYSTLVNPGRPVPKEIQQLTGITDADLIGKPRFREVAADIMRIAAQQPVVGHNVAFDLAFLRAQGLLGENPALDTWELSSILLPGQASYSLEALLRRFGIEPGARHRALSDAAAAGRLFLQLCACAAALPQPVLVEINRLARGSAWSLRPVFAAAAEEALAGGRTTAGLAARWGEDATRATLERLAPGSPLLEPLRNAFEPLATPEQTQDVDTAALAAMLAPGGAFSRCFSGYEHRPPQLVMLQTVAEAFNHKHHLLVEAGTGTGKSLAYLLPAIAFAVLNHCRVVVSTNTINLQDQLFNKDLPDLQRILADNWKVEQPFRAALLKGRSHYLCPRRFLALMARPDLNHDELRGIARILVWLPGTRTGDQEELSLPSAGDRYVWSQMAADNEACSLERCHREMGGRCFFYRARKQAETAHILVVNHALLMADAATENRVLPEYRYLIVDEAHHLEDAVTDQLSFKADSQALMQLFSALHATGAQRSGGLLADVLSCLRTGLPADQTAVLREQIHGLQADIETVHARLGEFWQALEDALRGLLPSRGGAGDYDARVRITEAVRDQPVWVDIEVGWDNLAITWQTVLKRLAGVGNGLQELLNAGPDLPGLEGLCETLTAAHRDLTASYAQLEAWTTKPDHNGVYWLEVGSQNGRFTLRSAPLHVGPLVQEHVFFHNEMVVMTSATMRTSGSFDYLRDRLQAYEADTATVGSPFDYPTSTLLYLPADLPEPTASGYQVAVERALIDLARALGGRTLALFTSNAQLRHTAEGMRSAMAEANITLLAQSGGVSRHHLLESFKRSPRAVLLGTRSFWEGVDVIGPALSALVLVRLPFAVPSDPLVAARAETFDDPFYQYQVPDAILRFRQGFGRLIRSKTDRGIVVVLDRRIQSKNYGQLFLDSLPDCTVHRGPLMNLPSAARDWMARP